MSLDSVKKSGRDTTHRAPTMIPRPLAGQYFGLIQISELPE